MKRSEHVGATQYGAKKRRTALPASRREEPVTTAFEIRGGGPLWAGAAASLVFGMILGACPAPEDDDNMVSPTSYPLIPTVTPSLTPLEVSPTPGPAPLAIESFGGARVPEDSDYVDSKVLNGSVNVTVFWGEAGCSDAYDRTLAFVAGDAEEAVTGTVFADTNTLLETCEEDRSVVTWNTNKFTATAATGASYEADDLFTVFATLTEKTNGTTEIDRAVVQLDNTAPISQVLYVCRDEAATECYPFYESDDEGNPLWPGFVVSQTLRDQIYFYGLAADKNFLSYRFTYVGPESEDEKTLCQANVTDNTQCTGLDPMGSPTGYGTPMTAEGQPTLLASEVAPEASQAALLLMMNAQDFPPGAYALRLVVASGAYLGGGGTPQDHDVWLTFNILP